MNNYPEINLFDEVSIVAEKRNCLFYMQKADS